MAGALSIVTGHEGAGVVEAVGSSVSGVAVGDHVVLSFDSCGLCDRCQSGHPAYCLEWMAQSVWPTPER
ncbi:alcohol dehydrogenase catalytic domain-containing protein [Mycobacterium sp. SVM_VP21]|nr:alcohol dehydrogenase catalytic domain-containing protein [Mycobacterium sp. SVM_VP21]